MYIIPTRMYYLSDKFDFLYVLMYIELFKNKLK